jgi:hypothetical protein
MTARNDRAAPLVGKSDPFAEVYLDGELIGETDVHNNSNNPVRHRARPLPVVYFSTR